MQTRFAAYRLLARDVQPAALSKREPGSAADHLLADVGGRRHIGAASPGRANARFERLALRQPELTLWIVLDARALPKPAGSQRELAAQRTTPGRPDAPLVADLGLAQHGHAV